MKQTKSTEGNSRQTLKKRQIADKLGVFLRLKSYF